MTILRVGAFFFFLETGFHHVAQVGLDLLISSDLSALASQVVGCYRHMTPCPEGDRLDTLSFTSFSLLSFFRITVVCSEKWYGGQTGMCSHKPPTNCNRSWALAGCGGSRL